MYLTSRLKDWENPQLLHMNREPMHSPWGAYSSESEAAGCNRRSSPYVRLLDGTWTFQLAPNPESVPAGFYEEDFDSAGWGRIQVPGSWELQGYDKPIYTNILYPFDLSDPKNARHLRSHKEEELADRFLPLNPPYVPDNNPTGCYLTTFEVPADWDGRDIFLTFEAVESAFYLWVNGICVGFSKDSKLSAEFLVTEYVRQGTNKLALQVMRWSDGTYLEDQDYWHLSGIHRSVLLYSKPKQQFIRDYKVLALLDDEYQDGKLVVYAYTSKKGNYGEYRVRARLLDAKGKDAISPLVSEVATATPMYMKADWLPEDGAALLAADVPVPLQWSPEEPNLYTLVLTLLDPEGREMDFESCKVGFRRVELSPEGVILLNGKRLVVRGVNRHEHHPDTGRTVSQERMREEIIRMKQLNFNAVRTCHYPNDPFWYELCDELGMVVVDEANLETHGIQGTLSKDPEWAHAYLDRARRMVLRDKNHPSILFWSLGNESSVGVNHAAMAGWIRYYDPYRLVQYESGDPGPLITDVRVPMYPSLSWVEEVMADSRDLRPMVMCEYAYAKSNSSGNFYKFWEMVDKYPRFQGGFIWDWSDKAIRIRRDDGTHAWGYGGDFGESVVDFVPDMCLNGVVSPDLELHPGAYEIKKIQAPVSIKGEDVLQGAFTLVNKYSYLDISHLELAWQLMENGMELESGTMTLPIAAPGEQVGLRLPFTLPEAKAGAEYFIHLTLRLREASPWAPAGYELYSEQFALPLPFIPARAASQKPVPGLAIEEDENGVIVRGTGFTLVFDTREGLITAYERNGVPLLHTAAKESYFRAPTGIDAGQDEPYYYAGEWQAYGLDRLIREVRDVRVTLAGSTSVLLEVEAELRPEGSGGGFTSQVTYTVRGDGSVEIRNRVHAAPAISLIPRIGVTLTVPESLSRVHWYGRGPHENYCDRKHSAHIGLYSALVDEEPCPYIVPVECGGREDVRWFTLTDGEGRGLKFTGFTPLHMDVHRNSVEDYAKAKHVEELPIRDRIWVNIDHRHSGLGGDTGWTRNIHEEFQIKPGLYEFSFTMEPTV